MKFDSEISNNIVQWSLATFWFLSLNMTRKNNDDEDSLEIESEEETPSLPAELVEPVTKLSESSHPASSSRRLTSRQRALYSGQSDPVPEFSLNEPAPAELVSSPAKSTEEQIKRRIMRQEKIEMDKQATIDKLLLKQIKQPSKKQKLEREEFLKEKEQKNFVSQVPINMIRIVDSKEHKVLICNDLNIFDQFQCADKETTKKCTFCDMKKACLSAKTRIPICSSIKCFKLSLQ